MKKSNSKYVQYSIEAIPPFNDVISHFYFAENKSDQIIRKTLLPSYQTILIFNFGCNALLHSKQNTSIKIKKNLVLGPIKQSFDYSLPPNASILVANFKDDGFYRFFGMASIDDKRAIPTDNLVKENCFTTLWTDLNRIDSVQERVDYILEFCKPYLKDGDVITKQLTHFNDHNLNPIKAIASANNLSERSLQIKHKNQFGYSAKEINRYRRFTKVIQLIQEMTPSTSKVDWFDIINACGYYDQSQLIHDFNHYLNLSPSKYLKFQHDICNPMI